MNIYAIKLCKTLLCIGVQYQPINQHVAASCYDLVVEFCKRENCVCKLWIIKAMSQKLKRLGGILSLPCLVLYVVPCKYGSSVALLCLKAVANATLGNRQIQNCIRRFTTYCSKHG